MLRLRLNVLIGLSIVHGLLVIWGAGYFWLLPSQGVLGRVIRSVSTVNGANSRYGFFAPAVGPQARVRLLTVAGEELPISVSSSEGMQRIHNLSSLFLNSELSNAEIRSLAASWAAFGFSKISLAEKLIVIVEVFDPPSFREAQKGTQGKWRRYYESTFWKPNA